MDIVRVSQLLIVLFVGSVTLWYCITPYLISPHPDIVRDVLTKTKLTTSPSPASSSEKSVSLENWTKWRIFVNGSDSQDDSTRQVIYGNSKGQVPISHEATLMTMEWRSDYTISVDPESKIATRNAPLAGAYGIYNHFSVDNQDDKVKVIPRFLFGIPFDTIEAMYGQDVSEYPVWGVFTSSPRFDRIIIQAYMNVVTLSVIFLLYANNPPAAVLAKKTS